MVQYTEWRSISDGSIISSIPDSVVNQYRVEDFEEPWPDNIGTADMVVSGLSESTFNNNAPSVFADGTDDHGLAPIEILPKQESYGVAFTIETSDNDTIMGMREDAGANTHFWQFRTDRDGGRFTQTIEDANDNRLEVHSETEIDDGNTHAVILNKDGNDASDIDIYIDDMADGSAEQIIVTNQSFNHLNFELTADMGFFAQNDVAGGVINRHIEADSGIFEFNSEPYTESERQDFVDRRPEVS